jgi:RNA ligase (TIGR02306 family)
MFDMSRENNQMAYIAEITHLVPIRDADAIEKAVINAGWPVVVKKGEFEVGAKVLYFEIDSWVPTELAPFLSKGKEPREYNGVKGEKLRNIKLRGCRSQGLVLPISLITTVKDVVSVQINSDVFFSKEGIEPIKVEKGALLGDLLGVQKWEAPEGFASGNAKGNFPTAVPKTDAERIQNLRRDLEDWIARGLTFEVTEKLHGTSFTALVIDGEFGVCSRNLLLQEGEGTYWSVAEKHGLKEKMLAMGRNFAVQGEIIGPGVLGNQYMLPESEVFVFNVFDIDKKGYVTPSERHSVIEELGLKHVPVLENVMFFEGTTIDMLLEHAEGRSAINGSEREGLVFKCIEDPSIQFKAVSNIWLDKEK